VKRFTLLVFLLTLVLGISACSQDGSSDLPIAAPAVEDRASLLAAFREPDATTEVVDSIDQTFFSPQGSIVSVNGEEIQVFEYESAEAMETEASQVSPDGSSIGTSMFTWIDTPHFYKTGRVIVLYIGSDVATLDLLEKVIGPQFAGR
jgi:hypothetical protein